MSGSRDYKNCKVIVYDERDGKPIAQTSVLEYEKTSQTAYLDTEAFQRHDCTKVTALLFRSGMVYECKGTVRRQNVKGRKEIALYREQEKEDRATSRFVVNAPAMVESLLVSGRTVPLREPVKALAVNISTEGVLLRTASTFFNVGTAFRLRMQIAGDDVVITTAVTRIKKAEEKNVEYGCRFLAVSPAETAK